MKHPFFLRCLMATGIALAASSSYAVDVRINGFASVGGGKTLNEGITRQHNAINPDVAQGTETKNTFVADPVTEGVYDDDWSFKPDSNLGLQISADLGEGLAVTGQITGNGGEDFDAVVSWAYVSYQFDDNWSVMAGRQRLPLFYYSDFIDVGYAYHWIRPPQELVASDGDTFEGVKIRYANHIGNWDYSAEVYYGAGEETLERQGDIDIKAENQHGLVLKTNNDWLTLRATYSKASTIIDTPLADLTNQGTDDEPLDYAFLGFATEMNFSNNIFVVAEYTQGTPDDPAFSAISVGGPAVMEVTGSDKAVGWYVSTGIRLGEFTPHITYSQKSIDYETPFAEFEQKQDAITVGVRWDFHPSAALKLEYITRDDKSDDYYQNQVGSVGIPGVGILSPGVGYGEPAEVDLIAFSLDVIF